MPVETIATRTTARERAVMFEKLNLVRLPGAAVACTGCGRPVPVALRGSGPDRCPKCWSPLPVLPHN